MKKKVLLEEMSWYEYRDVMASNDLIIVPVGSCEQHGLHNPLGEDTYIAKAAAIAIGEKANAPVAPVMPVGNARTLMGFPGTATIDPELLRQVMVQVCESLIKHGAKRFLFINGHGGNTPTLKVVSADLYSKHDVISTQTEWWTTLMQISEYKDKALYGHGGITETSMMMAVDEGLIDLTKAKTVLRKPLTDALGFENALMFKGATVPVPVPVNKYTPTGNYGIDVEKSSTEFGKELFDIYVDYCVGLCEELRKVTI